MNEILTTDALVIAIIAIVVMLIAWAIWGRRKPEGRALGSTIDPMDADGPRAERNNLLVDAPPAAVVPIVMPDPLAGAAEAVAASAVNETVAANEAEATGDDLRRIKGVGPKLVAQLHALGVTRYDQIAAWNEDDLARIDGQLGSFRGRPQRDNWVEQARLLAAGDTAAYEAKFGKV